MAGPLSCPLRGRKGSRLLTTAFKGPYPSPRLSRRRQGGQGCPAPFPFRSCRPLQHSVVIFKREAVLSADGQRFPERGRRAFPEGHAPPGSPATLFMAIRRAGRSIDARGLYHALLVLTSISYRFLPRPTTGVPALQLATAHMSLRATRRTWARVRGPRSKYRTPCPY
jgi:hypothetical protein